MVLAAVYVAAGMPVYSIAVGIVGVGIAILSFHD